MSETNNEIKCPMRFLLKMIGGKWKPLILQQLISETRRFGELQRLIPEINKQMLTKNLRELESDGILKRKVYAEVPPKVEYSLTAVGQSLVPVLKTMESWGKEQLESLLREK
ncbi:MAG: helix-turn-helix transcriptional regulator [Bacteroidia bacterium]|nr:helix-turn-helix transcriptional regulator [Bacteroidia bacterium]